MNNTKSWFPVVKNNHSIVSFEDRPPSVMMKMRTYIAGILLFGGAALVLAACGGGGGGNTSASNGSSPLASITGSAIDAPLANAQITFTTGAPLNVTGYTTIGSITANASGVYSSNVALPSSDTPVFGNAVDRNNSAVVLSSYIGQSTALAALAASGVALTSTNLPDLDITPVTTAALAVYYQVNGSSYANLTPATYATNLQQYNGDILAISAAIKAVGDNLCTPSMTVSSTTSLAAAIATASNLTSGNSTTLATAASTLGGNCATVLATLPQQISANPEFSPGLYVGDVIDAGASSVVPSTPIVTSSSSTPATYTLEGVIAESGWSTSASAVAANPATVFNDTTIAVDSSGNITSTDGFVSGTLVGNSITLTVTNGSQQYSLRGKAGVIQTTLVSGGTAYSIQAGGTNTATTSLTNFAAVLAPASVTPVWNGNTAPTTTACSAGAFLIQLNAYGSGIGGGRIGECIVPSLSGWTMSTATLTTSSYIGDNVTSSVPPSLTASNWSEVSAASPFILSAANASVTSNGTTLTGTMYYVMGSSSVIFASSTGNSLLNMNCNSLTQLAESGPTANNTSSNNNNGNTAASGVTGNNDNNGNTAASGISGNTDNNGNQANSNNYH